MTRRDGAPAGTRYHVVGTRGGVSLVLCRLLTGRTHQIRVHLAVRGWPIVGDQTYGRAPLSRLDDALLDRMARALTYQALHAWRLAFRHPRTGAALVFTAPPPQPIEALLARAGLSGAAANVVAGGRLAP
jgi:23S rRNA pseudouridine1911/1915/1917 synthase